MNENTWLYEYYSYLIYEPTLKVMFSRGRAASMDLKAVSNAYSVSRETGLPSEIGPIEKKRCVKYPAKARSFWIV